MRGLHSAFSNGKIEKSGQERTNKRSRKWAGLPGVSLYQRVREIYAAVNHFRLTSRAAVLIRGKITRMSEL